MTVYWLVLVLVLGGVFTWLLYSQTQHRTNWPRWVQLPLSAFFGLCISGYFVLVMLSVLNLAFPDTFAFQNRWEKCDPSYPDVCIPPGPPDLDCEDIQFANFKVVWPDTHHLDADGNGVGCEQ